MIKKLRKEDCIFLLRDKYQKLKLKGEVRYPRRNDFTERQVVAIKAFLGPWPRALELAGIKPIKENIDKLTQKEKNNQIIEYALNIGFNKANVINTKKIKFNEEYRKYCEENLCGQYNNNYSCPPICGTPDQMKKQILTYKKAIVLQSKHEISSLKELEKLNLIKKHHNQWMLSLLKKMQQNNIQGLMIGASNCTICDECEFKKGNLCKYPLLKFSCMSAYCIDVKNLADLCKMNYEYKEGILYFFGIIAF